MNYMHTDGTKRQCEVHTNIVRNVVARYDTRDLQAVRRTVEGELIDACKNGIKGTQAHVGQLELLEAIGAELLARNALLPAPPYFDTCMVDGVRLSFQTRVF